MRHARLLGRRESIAWVVIPAFGAWWHAHNLRDTWWFFDDWSLIERVLNVSLAEGLTTGYNGHFWMIGYLMYRVQVLAIGLESHTFIAAMCVACGLVVLVAIAAALRGGGVSTVVSLLIAAHVAYLGPGAQNMLFAIQAASMLTVGLCIGAGAVALTRPPNPTTMLLVGSALLLAVAGDSGHALSGILFASIVVLMSWRGRPRLVVVPGVVAVVSWHLFGALSERWPGSVGTRARFAASLLTHTSGALIGRGALAGGFLLCATIALVTIGLRAGFVTGRSRTLLVAAGASLVLVLAAIAQARAGLVGHDFASSNRYLANAAVPLVISVLPASAATVRGLQTRWPTPVPGRWRPVVAALLPPALVVWAWLSGLGALRDYRAGFVTTHQAIRQAARSASIIVRDGCPFGTTLDLGALVIGPPSPQLTTALVAELTRRGALDPPLDEAPDPAVVERICRPS